MSWEFCWDVPDPWGCLSLVLQVVVMVNGGASDEIEYCQLKSWERRFRRP